MADPVRYIKQLQSDLQSASTACDWEAVADCDARIQDLLKQVSSDDPVLKPHLSMLQKVHQQAVQQVLAERERLNSELMHLGNNREGLIAYGQWQSEEV